MLQFVTFISVLCLALGGDAEDAQKLADANTGQFVIMSAYDWG